MQTFLPYKDFKKTAKVLDMRRLGKQRVECLQILQTLAKGDAANGWKNHPAVKMWKGYEHALFTYGLRMCAEWVGRGYTDTCAHKMFSIYASNFAASNNKAVPPWLGNRKFHKSHQSNLLRKDETHYSKYFNVENNLPYIWPR